MSSDTTAASNRIPCPSSQGVSEPLSQPPCPLTTAWAVTPVTFGCPTFASFQAAGARGGFSAAPAHRAFPDLGL